MPLGFHLLIATQFASALADNALLIVTIALLIEQGLPGWWAPMAGSKCPWSVRPCWAP